MIPNLTPYHGVTVSPAAREQLARTVDALAVATDALRRATAEVRKLVGLGPCGGCRGDWSDTTAQPENWRDGACGLHLAAAHLRHALDTRGGDAQAWGDHVVEAAERLLGEVWR
jgi:hypothetical protein